MAEEWWMKPYEKSNVRSVKDASLTAALVEVFNQPLTVDEHLKSREPPKPDGPPDAA